MPERADDGIDGPEGAASGVRWAVVLLFAVASFLLADVISDLAFGDVLHVVLEAAAALLAVAGGAWLWLRSRVTSRRLAAELASVREEAERWRQESRDVLLGLRSALDRQFQRWSLSPSEAEIALLLLNGMSLASIAEARGTSERTVRAQARAVYRKAGLAGRAELAAFFLEDLLAPPADGRER